MREGESEVSDATGTVRRRYDRFARVYDRFESLPEKLLLSRLRKRLIPRLKGRVLEVGVGTGKNLRLYSDEAELVGLDVSPKMLAIAEGKRRQLGRENVSLVLGDAEHLPFRDSDFDVVVATFVFCSVPDPVRAFREVRRVLRPDGEAVFLEHVRSSSAWKGVLLDLLNPLTVRLMGVNVNRETRRNLEKGGLIVRNDEHLAMGDVVRLFVCGKSR